MFQTDKLEALSRVACAVVFALASAMWCHAADVVFVRSETSPSQEQRELETAASFYGLDLTYVTVGVRFSDRALGLTVQQDSTMAVVVEARALSSLNQESLLRALRRKSGQGVPLLIVGITPDTDAKLLKSWSGGAVIGCKDLQSSLPLHYAFGHVPALTQQLSDSKISLAAGHTFYLSLAASEKTQQILGAEMETSQPVPLFVAASVDPQNVLFAVKMPSSNLTKDWRVDNIEGAFAEIAPVMMFVKHSAGDRGWHALRHYANLTIDDPWLREPYGFLSYNGLLQEMERHNFHTTIAFIPWNYDRSEPQVAALFRNHADRFSISIHGNDHDHKEFTDFDTKPLPDQAAALQQALVRMDGFQTRTGIPYDRVFVFPHSIGSEKILDELKNRNFLATVNASNVPMDRQEPTSLSFALRPVTLSFADFPSLFRYSPKIETESGFLAMNEFLDNPLLFYCHHDFFASGIDAFNSTADAVNRLEPDTQWSGLGEIVRHLYLVKQRDDSAYDVLSFSQDMQLDNTTARDLTYYVRKEESAVPAGMSVTIDGAPAQFVSHDGFVEFTVSVPAHERRNARIVYREAANSVPVRASSRSVRVYFLRESSDFRDIVLSKSALSRGLVDLYYKYELTPTLVVLCVLTLLVCSGCLIWRVRIMVQAHHHARAGTAAPAEHSGSQV